jgi:hypothetical protein
MAYLLIAIFISVLVFFLIGGREAVGDWVNQLFPKATFQKGDKAHIYLNGKYNRLASISKVDSGNIYIYNNLSLPVDYRGKFYAVGVDCNDGSKLVYVKMRKHYRFVRMAELVRKAFNIQDDEEQLLPDDSDIVNGTEVTETEAEDEV